MSIGANFVTIKVDIETGEVEFTTSTHVTQEEERSANVQPVKDEIEEIKRGKRYLRVGEIIQTINSPGCVYWNGIRWIKFC